MPQSQGDSASDLPSFHGAAVGLVQQSVSEFSHNQKPQSGILKASFPFIASIFWPLKRRLSFVHRMKRVETG